MRRKARSGDRPVSYDAAWAKQHARYERHPRWSTFTGTGAIAVIIVLGTLWFITAKTVLGHVAWAVYVAGWVVLAPTQRRRTRDLIRLSQPPAWYTDATLLERVLYRPARAKRRRSEA